MSRNIGCRALVSSWTAAKSTMGTKSKHNFQIRGQSHRVNELLFSHKHLHLQNQPFGLKYGQRSRSLYKYSEITFLGKVGISCHIADLSLFFSIIADHIKKKDESRRTNSVNCINNNKE